MSITGTTLPCDIFQILCAGGFHPITGRRQGASPRDPLDHARMRPLCSRAKKGHPCYSPYTKRVIATLLGTAYHKPFFGPQPRSRGSPDTLPDDLVDLLAKPKVRRTEMTSFVP